MKDLTALNNDSLTMSSLEIAELTDKRHDNVLQDIERILEEVGIGASIFKESYTSKQNKKLPCYNLPLEYANLILDKYKGLARIPNRLQEEASLKTIEQLLNIILIRQFKCLNYRIDGYDSINNIAYEIDEPHHKHNYNKVKDEIRQSKIEKLLKCKFVRIKL